MHRVKQDNSPSVMNYNNNNDDFLWDCAFSKDLKDRKWIIPDREELTLEMSKDQSHFYTHNIVNSIDKETENYQIKVLETRKFQGVFDIIGGEVWEASLLLCSYLLLHQESFLLSDMNILELGSGMGLPSYLLLNMALRQRSRVERALITMTDYEPPLIENLRHVTETCYKSQTSDTSDSPSEEASTMQLAIGKLDWSDFEGENIDDIIPSDSSAYCDNFNYVIGSALCYATFHANALFHVIKYYLSGVRCKEIVILQIADREGFATLIQLLEEAEIRHIVSPVSEDVYSFAQSFTCEKIPSVGGLSEDVGQWLEYSFPSAYHGTEKTDGAIRTDREAFALLRIFPE